MTAADSKVHAPNNEGIDPGSGHFKKAVEADPASEAHYNLALALEKSEAQGGSHGFKQAQDLANVPGMTDWKEASFSSLRVQAVCPHEG